MIFPNALPTRHAADAASLAATRAARLDREADFALQFGAVVRAERLAHRAEELRAEGGR